MNTEPSPPNEPKNMKNSSALALCLAFVPAAMLLALIAVGGNPGPGMMMAACIGSVACCFSSSFMLFARKTGLAIIVGVLFLILNGLIAFFFGCAATFHI
jgi:hypothetical protein